MSDEEIQLPKETWRRFKYLVVLLCCPLLLRIPLVSNFIKDVVLIGVNDLSDYRITIDNMSIRPIFFGIKLEGIEFQDKHQTLFKVPEGFVGFKLPFDGQIVRTVILDSPSVNIDIDALPKRSDATFHLPILPRIQIRSASVNVFNTKSSVSIPDLNMTHENGSGHLWTVEPLQITSGEYNILVSPFQWNDILMGDGSMKIDDINLDSSIGNLYGHLGISDDILSGSIESSVELDAIVKHPKWEGDGLLLIQVSPEGNIANPKVTFGLQAEAFTLTRQALTRKFTYQLDSLQGKGLYDNGQIALQGIDLGWADGMSTINGVIQPKENHIRITIEGANQNIWGLGQDLDLSPAPWVEMNIDSVTQLSGQLSPIDVAGTISIEGDTFATGSGNVRQKPPVLTIPQVYLAGDVQLTKTTLDYQLTTVRLQSNYGTTSTGVIEGHYSFPPPNLSNVDFKFDQLDLRLLRPLGGSEFIGIAKGGGTLEGPMKKLRLQSQYSVKDFQMLGFEYADELDVRIDGDNLKELLVTVEGAKKGRSILTGAMDVHFKKELWFDGQFSSESARANNLMAMFFDPLDVDAFTTGTVRVQGFSSDLHIDADMELTDVSLWGEPFDTGRFRLVQDRNHLTIEEFVVERNDGLGSAMMRGTRTNGNNNFEVLVGGLPIEYLSWIIDGKIPVRGKLDFLGTIQGDGFLPNGSLYIRDFWHGPNKLGHSNLLIHNQDEGLVIQGRLADGIMVEGVAGYSLDEDFAFDVSVDDFPVEALYSLSLSDKEVKGEVSGSGLYWQRTGEMGGAFSISDAKLTWSDRWLQLRQPTAVDWDGVQMTVTPFTLTGSGQTDLSIDARKDGHKHTVAFDGTVDMAVVEMFLYGTESAAGTGVVNGRWTESGVDATMNIQNGFLQGLWFPHPIESIRSELRITDQEVMIDEWDSIVGGGSVEMTGSVALEKFLPKQYDLALDMLSSRIQLLDWLPPVVGSGQFRVSGDAELPMIRGAVEVSEMTFVDRIGWEGALITFAPDAIAGTTVEGAEPYFEYDIDFTAADTIRIRNNLADMTASADLKFVGDMAHPGMIGRIDLNEGGRALFKERDFDVLRGSLRYEDPFSFDPILDIALETSIITPENEVAIKYFITGLYSDWQTHTTSTPSLPQADINALLLFGMTRRELETEGGLGAALAIEGSDLVVSKFGTSQRFVEVGSGLFQSELLRLDRVDIISGPTDRNSAYVSSALRLLAEKDIGDGTIRLEQNITDTTDVFVSWEQKLSQRLYTRLYWASQQQGRSINGRGAVGAEFEVQWELD